MVKLVYINVSHFFCVLYILKRARCLLTMGVIAIYIYLQKCVLQDVFIYTKSKKMYFLRKEYIFYSPNNESFLEQ